MEITTAPELLRHCLDELRNGWIGWLISASRRHRLIGRIEMTLGRFEAEPAYRDLVDAARLRYADDAAVEIPADPLMRIDRDGIWIGVWVRPAATGTADWPALLATLPTIAREVFLLHRADGMTFGSIARRLGISVASVEAHFASALAILDAEAMKGAQ